MRRATAFTLIELLVVLCIMVLLVVLIVPTTTSARQIARRASCANQLHAISVGLGNYCTTNNLRFPPFGFSDKTANLGLSGHWGGIESPSDPLFKTTNLKQSQLPIANLWALQACEMVSAEALICPSSPLRGRPGESYFSYTRRFSTYSLRFPHSREVFTENPELANYSMSLTPGQLLDAYTFGVGGRIVSVGTGERGRLPFIRQDRTYMLETPDGSPAVFDPMSSAIVADTFWMHDYSQAAGPGEIYSQHWSWCHGRSFNVLMGNGHLRMVEDDGTVASGSCQGGRQPIDETGLNMGPQVQKIWAFFESRR